MKKKIVIVGGGPGGYETALEGAKLGHDITLIEKSHIGGTCLHWGCIPTKTLYKNAGILRALEQKNAYGIADLTYTLDYSLMLERKQQVIETLENDIVKSLKKAGVTLITGEAILGKDHKLFVDKMQIDYDELVIATGSTSKKLLKLDHSHILSSKTLLNLKELPKKIVIIGAGVIGMEFASILNALGTQVTVLEYLPNILPMTDMAIGKRLSAYAKKQGIEIVTGAKVEEARELEEGLLIQYTNKKGILCEIKTDYILEAVGRKPNLQIIDGLDILVEKEAIKVDSHFKTNIDHIYAIGDVNGLMQLAHAASNQGKWLMHYLDGSNLAYKPLMPSAIFTFPEIASVGKSEEVLKEEGVEYTVHKTMYGAVGKAHAANETDGYMKILTTPDDYILGIHIIGYDASNLIHEGVLAMNNNITYGSLKSMIHIHPTFSEIYTL